MTTDLYQSLIESDDISSKKQKDDYLTEKEVAKEYPIYTSNSLRVLDLRIDLYFLFKIKKGSLQERRYRECLG